MKKWKITHWHGEYGDHYNVYERTWWGGWYMLNMFATREAAEAYIPKLKQRRIDNKNDVRYYE